MSSLVAFVLGAGPNVGLSTANALKAKGYGVAVASRSVTDGVSADGHLLVKLDLGDPNSIRPAFERVKSHFGSAPSAVIYNGAARTVLPEDDPLSGATIENIVRDTNVNAISTLMAAKYAVQGFKDLPTSHTKTFIFTGNKLNRMARPQVLTFGMGKAAVAHSIPALIAAYGSKGYRFYYADERQPNGEVVGMSLSGPAHAEEYLKLISRADQGPWEHTFVKGQGYCDFLK